MLLKHVVLEILQPAIQVQKKQKKNLDGPQNMESKKCVKIPGDGSLITRMVMMIN